jgi:hypothetical protein
VGLEGEALGGAELLAHLLEQGIGLGIDGRRGRLGAGDERPKTDEDRCQAERDDA